MLMFSYLSKDFPMFYESCMFLCNFHESPNLGYKMNLVSLVYNLRYYFLEKWFENSMEVEHSYNTSNTHSGL